MSRIASQKAETRRNITTAGLLAGLLCALALACACITAPAPAFAETGSGTQGDPYVLSDGSMLNLGTPPTVTTYYTDGDGGTAVFEPATGSDSATLTLNDMAITSNGQFAIYVSGDLTIVAQGKNTIKGGTVAGIMASRDHVLTIMVESGATLEVSDGTCGVFVNNSSGKVCIENAGTLSLSSNGIVAIGCSKVSVNNSGTLTISFTSTAVGCVSADINNSGTLTVSAEGNALECNDVAITSSGKVVLASSSGYAVRQRDSTVTVSADLSNGGSLYLASSSRAALSGDVDKVTVKGGSVYFAGDGAFDNSFSFRTSSPLTLSGGAIAVLAMSGDYWVDKYPYPMVSLPDGATLITNAGDDVRSAIANGTSVYKVSFNADGGTGTMADAVGTGSSYTLPACSFAAPSGKCFAGWAVGSASGEQASVGNTITISGNITLYAKWEADSKATPTITWPTASSIDYGQALSQSHLTGGSTDLGTFTWTKPGQVLAAGTHSASVTFTPNDEASSTYDWTGVATTGSASVVVRKATPAVSVSAGEITGAGDTRTMTLTATVSGVPGTGAPTGSVAFKAGGVTIGTAELAKGTATCSWAASADTAYSVVAVYVGDANYSAARSEALGINTARSNQSIDIASVDGKVYGDAPFELTLSSAGSGTGAVTWTSSDPNIVSISGSTATIHAAGEVTITAMKAADDTYNAAEAAIDIEVDERPLTLAAANQSMVAGEDIPSLTWEVADGSLAEGDYVASADVSCAADTAAAGTHSISISGATIKNASGDDVTDSYNITYVPGTLTVEPSNEPDPEKAAQKIVGGKKVVKVKAKKATGKLAKKKAFRIGCRAKYEPKAATLTYGLKKVTVKKASGKYKKASKRIAKRIKVGKKGKVTLKKGLPKGTYKIKVRVKAKATASHAAATKVKTIKIRVK